MGKKDTIKPTSIHQTALALVPPPSGVRRAGNVGRKSKLFEVWAPDIEWIPHSSPEEVLKIAKAYAAPHETSNIGVALRIANKILKSGASGPIAGEPTWVRSVPFRGQEWRRKRREKEKRKAFAEVTKHCCLIPHAAILPFLGLLAEALRIGPKLRNGLRSKKDLCCAAVHEAYAHAWSKKLGAGGSEAIEREGQALQKKFECGDLALKPAENLWNNVKARFFPTREEVRASLKVRISKLLGGDEAQKSNAMELSKILQGKHFSDYSGQLKFAEPGKRTA